MKWGYVDYKQALNLVLAIGLFTTTLHTTNESNRSISPEEYREILLEITFEAYYDATTLNEAMFLRCLIEHLRITPEPLDLLSVAYDPKLQAIVRNIIMRATIHVGVIS